MIGELKRGASVWMAGTFFDAVCPRVTLVDAVDRESSSVAIDYGAPLAHRVWVPRHVLFETEADALREFLVAFRPRVLSARTALARDEAILKAVEDRFLG